MLYDSRRKRAVFLSQYVDSIGGVWGGTGPAYWDLSTNPNAPTRTTFTVTGDITIPGGNFKVPGWAYDPIGDRYLLWLGGKTIYWVDPTTFVATAYTPSGGITPPTRVWGEGTNGGYSLEYLPGDDVFIGVNNADTSGFEVFAPVRNAPSVPSQK
jgi:hypothetical protein